MDIIRRLLLMRASLMRVLITMVIMKEEMMFIESDLEKSPKRIANTQPIWKVNVPIGFTPITMMCWFSCQHKFSTFHWKCWKEKVEKWIFTLTASSVTILEVKAFSTLNKKERLQSLRVREDPLELSPPTFGALLLGSYFTILKGWIVLLLKVPQTIWASV